MPKVKIQDIITLNGAVFVNQENLVAFFPSHVELTGPPTGAEYPQEPWRSTGFEFCTRGQKGVSKTVPALGLTKFTLAFKRKPEQEFF